MALWSLRTGRLGLRFFAAFGTIAYSGFRVNPVSYACPSSLGQSLRKWGLATLAAVALAAPAGAWSKGTTDDVVALAALPAEAQSTERLIRTGGPFPYSKDGTVFGNRERSLPRRERGYYREYTVKTPGARDRGAQRIVCGGAPAHHPQACYYTADHYATFKRIVN